MITATHRPPGLILRDHRFQCPLDHDRPGGPKIEVFAREVMAPQHEGKELPWLVYFQGGPGMESPRPTESGGWLGRALEEYRVLLLDQRGTGLSSPLNASTCAALGNAFEQAEHLSHFRADGIVGDAELIRRELLGADQSWTVLGQSFGGFCVVHYLSQAPQGLKEAFITGGLPPLEATADDIYRATYPRVLDRNRRYYERYPEDESRVIAIVRMLQAEDIRLPGGDRLSPRKFQQLGLMFGMSDGFERMHYLLEEAFPDGGPAPRPTFRFLAAVQHSLGFETTPLYALLHESIYCQGFASNWAAERVREEFAPFQIRAGAPVMFCGEMVFPWMFEEYGQLQLLGDVAEVLAQKADWPRLYDPARLANNPVPAAAVIYADDMYVEARYSQETARAIPHLRPWITSEYDHNGLRADGPRIFERLMALARGWR